jgi:hypothetical protein
LSSWLGVSETAITPPQHNTGIYPLDAACHAIKPEAWAHPFPPPDKFDIEAEVAWIDQMCAEGKAVAVGECGLDAYYCTDPEELREQERVLRLLIEGAFFWCCDVLGWVLGKDLSIALMIIQLPN